MCSLKLLVKMLSFMQQCTPKTWKICWWYCSVLLLLWGAQVSRLWQVYNVFPNLKSNQQIVNTYFCPLMQIKAIYLFFVLAWGRQETLLACYLLFHVAVSSWASLEYSRLFLDLKNDVISWSLFLLSDYGQNLSTSSCISQLICAFVAFAWWRAVLKHPLFEETHSCVSDISCTENLSSWQTSAASAVCFSNQSCPQGKHFTLRP